MPSFRTTRPVRHTPSQMFELVADVERYPEFLPLCEGLGCAAGSQSGEGVESLVAEMSVGYKAIHETFTIAGDPRPDAACASSSSMSTGPFSYPREPLDLPQPTPAGCEVEFFINYEFKSFALGLLMGAVFDKAFRKLRRGVRGRGRTRSMAKRASRVPTCLADGLLQERERILDRRHADGAAAEVAIAALQVLGRAAGGREPEMDEPDRLRRGRAAGAGNAGDRRPRPAPRIGRARPAPSRAPPARSPRRARRWSGSTRRAGSVFAAFE